jgi:hypothetical protein
MKAKGHLYNYIQKNKVSVIIGCIMLGACIYIIADTFKNSAQMDVIAKKEVLAGGLLAKQYCRSCHMLPEPSLLSKAMWAKGVLPRMGPFLGIVFYHGKSYYRANDVAQAFFPQKPIIDSVQWGSIVKYYLTLAPDVLPEQTKAVAIKKELPFFTVQLPPSAAFYSTVSMTSFIKIDTSVTPHRLIVNDGIGKRFILADARLNFLNGFATRGPVVDLSYEPGRILACSIGNTLEANNQTNGDITPIAINNKNEVTPATSPLFNNLARPVKITRADLNNDGKMDYLVAQFGNLVGELSWMENKGNQQYVAHTLRKSPGALNAVVYDYNHDGLPDVYAQFAQGQEGLFLFTNKGHGQFQEMQLISLPPTYGSTSFSMVDFNKDGFPDIVYTCGDNGDYTQVLKPYHGVYIYLNNGHNQFTQKYFYPINGCNKAIAMDFDGDGLIDIATISFYPSSAQPEEAFVYLQNKGNFNFQPYSLPIGTPFQKGITMDAGDLDGDGKPDLVLGNGYYTSDSTSAHKEPLFIVLKNSTPTKK